MTQVNGNSVSKNSPVSGEYDETQAYSYEGLLVSDKLHKLDTSDIYGTAFDISDADIDKYVDNLINQQKLTEAERETVIADLKRQVEREEVEFYVKNALEWDKTNGINDTGDGVFYEAMTEDDITNYMSFIKGEKKLADEQEDRVKERIREKQKELNTDEQEDIKTKKEAYMQEKNLEFQEAATIERNRVPRGPDSGTAETYAAALLTTAQNDSEITQEEINTYVTNNTNISVADKEKWKEYIKFTIEEKIADGELTGVTVTWEVSPFSFSGYLPQDATTN